MYGLFESEKAQETPRYFLAAGGLCQIGTPPFSLDEFADLVSEFLNLKVGTLTTAEEALQQEDSEHLWQQFGELVYESIPEKDMQFHFDTDERHGKGLASSQRYEKEKQPEYVAGGVKARIYFVQFCMREISLGAFQKTRESLTDFIGKDSHSNRRFRFENYSALMSSTSRNSVDGSLGQFLELSNKEIKDLGKQCDRFGEFMVKEAKREGTLKIPTKAKYLDEVKARITVRQALIQHRAELEHNAFGCMHPYHDDEYPSVSLHDNDRKFHCHSCGRGGDVIDAYRILRNVEKAEAIRQLAEMAVLNRETQLPSQSTRKPRVPQLERRSGGDIETLA